MNTRNQVRPEQVEYTGSQGNRLVGDRWMPDEPTGTVLLLHGGGQTRHSWARTAQRLADSGWTAITVDARGHGDSAWTSEYRLDDFIGDLRVVAAGARPHAIVGASLGGRTAFTAEGEGPSLCSALVLVDIAPAVDPAEQRRIQAFLRSAPDGFASVEEAAAAVDTYRGGRGRRNPAGLRKNLRRRVNGRWYWHWDPKYLHGTMDPSNSAPERLNSAASTITVPTLLVRGTKSKMVSAESAADLMQRIPRGELVEVEAGHMITGDDNDVFTQHLTAFLTKHSSE